MWDDTTDTMVSVGHGPRSQRQPGFPGEEDEASRWCGRQTLTQQAEGQGTSCGPRCSYQGQPLSAREPKQTARGLAKAQAGTEGTVKSVTLFSFFFKTLFLIDLHTQSGAGTYNLKTKSCILDRLSQPGAPKASD